MCRDAGVGGLRAAAGSAGERFARNGKIGRRAPMEFDLAGWARYSIGVNAVESTTELSGAAVLPIPREIAAQLPKSGKARIIVLTDEDTDEAQWRAGAYEQFLRDDSAADAIYESLR
jgi:hypothetical protein